MGSEVAGFGFKGLGLRFRDSGFEWVYIGFPQNIWYTVDSWCSP